MATYKSPFGLVTISDWPPEEDIPMDLKPVGNVLRSKSRECGYTVMYVCCSDGRKPKPQLGLVYNATITNHTKITQFQILWRNTRYYDMHTDSNNEMEHCPRCGRKALDKDAILMLEKLEGGEDMSSEPSTTSCLDPNCNNPGCQTVPF